MISPEDFRRLSATCKQELIALLNSPDKQPPEDEIAAPFEGLEGEAMDYDQSEPDYPAIDDVFDKKRVVSITVKQAAELVAKFSAKPRETLKLFASGLPLSPEDLFIGENRPYVDKATFKRSFVGAVNRRLRNTVWKGREDRPVLFSSNFDESRISIKPLTAASLRQALDVAEPTPEFEFFETESGEYVPTTTKAAKQLQERLQMAWREFAERPDDGCWSIGRNRALRHFIDLGFQASIGTTVAWNEKLESPVFKFDSTAASTHLHARLKLPPGVEDDCECLEIFLSHPDLPGVVAGSGTVRLPYPPNLTLPPSPDFPQPSADPKFCVGVPGQPCGAVIPALRAKDPSVSRCSGCQSDYEKTHDTRRYIDEGIAGTREEHKKMRSQLWNDMVNRGR